MIKRCLITVSILFCFHNFFTQEDTRTRKDSLTPEEKKVIYTKPRTASIMSAILPGLGQVYNRKYWKVPIIYAGLGGLGYLFYVNQTEYIAYRNDVRAYYDDDPATVHKMYWYTGDQLQTLKLQYRKYRDFAIIGIGTLYLLNIIDANVDAHLKTFDVSDDLSLQIRPGFIFGTAYGTGLSVKLNFK